MKAPDGDFDDAARHPLVRQRAAGKKSDADAPRDGSADGFVGVDLHGNVQFHGVQTALLQLLFDTVPAARAGFADNQRLVAKIFERHGLLLS